MKKLFVGTFHNKEDTKNNYKANTDKYRKNFFTPKSRTVTVGNLPSVRQFVKDLQYYIFGMDLPDEELASVPESKKLDIATGGYDEDEAIPVPPTTRSGLKIMTPSQLMTRLSILLAQLKAGNNSNKLKNEKRQIVYSLYRSKNLSKAIYKKLIENI